MSSKWKYADLPAQTRLDMLKNGNKDLYDEEVARTKAVMDARREVGLDTDAQEKWIDNVGYNYNLYLAGKAGESPDNVSTSGYAKAYYTPRDRSSGNGKIKPNTGRSALSIAKEQINNAAKSASEEVRNKYALLKEQTKEEFSEKSPILREILVNSGASLDGGRAKKFFADIQEKLNSVYDNYDKEMNQEIDNINKKYAQMADKLTEYRNSGVEDMELFSIAENLIKSLNPTSKIEFPKISTVKVETPKNEQLQIIPNTSTDKGNTQNKSNESQEEMSTVTEDVYSNAENEKASQQAKAEAIRALVDTMGGLSDEKIKDALTKAGITKENIAEILKRIKNNSTQK